MSEHTPTPWDQTVEAVVTADGSIIAEINNSEFPGDVDDANLRRIVAAVNATASFTTAGLEQIAAGGFSERLALLASLMMEEVKVKADDAELGKRLRQLIDATAITDPKHLEGCRCPECDPDFNDERNEDNEQFEGYALDRGDG